MKRPIIAFAAFLCGGILYSRYIYPAWGIMWLILAALLASFLIWYISKQKISCFFVLFVVAGFFLLQNSITDKYEFLHDAANNGESVIFSGVVTEVSRTARGRPRAVIRTDEFNINGEHFDAEVNILAYLDIDAEANVGRTVEVGGILRPLRFRRNPGAYDEFTFLRTRKIQYTIFPDTYTEGPPVFSIRAMTSSAANALQGVFYRVLPPQEAGILTAMLFGDRAGLAEETRDVFRQAGIFHILAVSGLHVTIVAAFLTGFLRKLGISPNYAALAVFAVILFYCVMTGAAPGTVRAVIMFSAYIFGAMFFRRGDGLCALALAAIIILLYEPLYLFDIGFRFSFAAVTGLMLLTPAVIRFFEYISARRPSLKKLTENVFFKRNVPPVIAASMASMPIQAMYFHEIPILAPLSNLIIVPTVAITVSLGFVVGLIGLLNIGIAGLLATFLRILVSFYDAFSSLVAEIPFAMVFTGRPRAVVIIAYAVCMLTVAWLIRRKKPKIAIKLSFGVLAVAFIISAAIPRPLTITMLYVGQGDSIMVSHGGQGILIDGGGRGLDRVGDDTGVWTVMPYMDYMGVERLSAAFVSHSHSDHAIGVIEIIEADRLERLYLSHTDDADLEVLDRLLLAAEITDTEVTRIGAGDVVVYLDGGVTISVLYPTAGTAWSGNDNSLVFMLEAGGMRMLFTGDIERAAERELLLMYANSYALKANVLKVAHHGSRTSSTEEFLAAVNPLIAVNSSGAGNIFGHPHPDVAERFADMGIPLLRTDISGAIRLFPMGDILEIQTMENLADERTQRALKIW